MLADVEGSRGRSVEHVSRPRGSTDQVGGACQQVVRPGGSGGRCMTADRGAAGIRVSSNRNWLVVAHARVTYVDSVYVYVRCLDRGL